MPNANAETRHEHFNEIEAWLNALEARTGFKNEPRAVKLQLALAGYLGAKLDALTEAVVHATG